MTYDKQDLLLDLRKIEGRSLSPDGEGDTVSDHREADEALLRFIDDEQIKAAYDAIGKWYE